MTTTCRPAWPHFGAALLIAGVGVLLGGCGGGQEGSTAAGSIGGAPVPVAAANQDLIPALVVSGSAKGLVLQTATEPGTEAGPASALRSRGVELDLGALARANPFGPRNPDTRGLLQIGFFDDAVKTVQITSVDPTASGGMAYVGTVQGDPNSSAVVVNNDGVVSIVVTSHAGEFTLDGDAVGGYTARELSPIKVPAHPQEPPFASKKTFQPTKRPLATAQAASDRDDGSTIDVMVIYTPSAMAYFANGSKAQMDAAIDANIAQVNAMYANSRVTQRLRLVYRGEVSAVERDLDSDLENLRENGDGFADEVHYLRNLYRADIVTLWANYRSSRAAGLGYLMGSEGDYFAASAFNVIWDFSARVYAHELGHNMGLVHDRIDTPANTEVTPEGSTTLTEISYAHGYIDTRNQFCTIMAVSSDCIFLVRIPYFSNPSVSYDNTAQRPRATIAPTGEPIYSNEARALNDTRDTVANFRKGLSTLTGPGIVSFTVGEASLLESAGSVRLTVTRHVGSTGAISVSYSTSNGSASASLGDYTASSGTLSWNDGDVSPRSIVVPLVQDSLGEGNEDFSVILSNPIGGASIGTSGSVTQTARITIMDDEPDGFPGNCALPAPWQVGDADSTAWVGSRDSFTSGACSLKSGTPGSAVTGLARSRVTSYVKLRRGTISFNWKMAVRQGINCLSFGVYNATSNGYAPTKGCFNGSSSDASYEVPWTSAAIAVNEAGIYTLDLLFQQQNSGAAAWIDSLRLPLDTASAPSLSSVTRGVFGGTTAVSFSAPWDAPYTQISSYRATCTAPGQPSRSAQAVASPIIVTGLTGGVSYTCSVAAVNGGGTGPSSASSIPVIPRAAGSDFSGDFNGDNRADLVWQNTITGERAIWLLNGTTYAGGIGLGTIPVAWDIAASGDFNNDGKVDLIWQNTTTGERTIWLLDGGAVIGSSGLGTVPIAWNIAAVGDFNGDGKSDVVWQNTSTGERAIWFLDGVRYLGGAGLGTVPVAWQIAGTGDFNNDGKADLVWQNTSTGERYVWFLNGSTLVSGAPLGTIPLAWQISGTGDFNGDGKTDLIWQNTTSGERLVWFLNGTTYIGGTGLGVVPSSWSIAR